MIWKFVRYDLEEGLFRHWKRFLPVLCICSVACIMLDGLMQYHIRLYRQGWSPVEYCLNSFFGRYPFQFDIHTSDSFTVPLEWVLIYLALAYCVGDYVRRDMEGFGMHMMVRGRKRSLWWFSKCIWCVLVNVAYFATVCVATICYSWVMYGDIRFVRHLPLLRVKYGYLFEDITIPELLVMALLVPLLAGIVQSLFQMILTLLYDGSVTMASVTAVLVLSCYYGNVLLPHGYAMVVRYFPDPSNPSFTPNRLGFGIVYLASLIGILAVAGYALMQRKDIYGKSFYS